jgi:hypothetical protein
MTKPKNEKKRMTSEDTDVMVKHLNEVKKEEKKQRELDVLKEFIEKQKMFRLKFKLRILKQEELKEMGRQINVNENTTNGKPEMLWYGMPMPMPILKATYNLGLEAYQEVCKDEMDLKNELLKKYELTEQDLNGIIGGKYVKEPKTKRKL